MPDGAVEWVLRHEALFHQSHWVQPPSCPASSGGVLGHHPSPWYSAAQDNLSASPSTWQGRSRRESLWQTHTHLWVLENGRAVVIATQAGVACLLGQVAGQVSLLMSCRELWGSVLTFQTSPPKGVQHQLANKTSQVEKETYREILKLRISIPFTALFFLFFQQEP